MCIIKRKHQAPNILNMLDKMFNETATCASPFVLNTSFVSEIPVFLLYMMLLVLSNLLAWLMKSYGNSMEQIGQLTFISLINNYNVVFLNSVTNIAVSCSHHIKSHSAHFDNNNSKFCVFIKKNWANGIVYKPQYLQWSAFMSKQ